MSSSLPATRGAEQAEIDRGLPLFEIAFVLVCFHHVASRIVNANHGIV
jgi:hypothetical protein